MTQRLDKIKTDKVRGPNSKLVTNGLEAQNENKHSSSEKIGRLQRSYKKKSKIKKKGKIKKKRRKRICFQ